MQRNGGRIQPPRKRPNAIERSGLGRAQRLGGKALDAATRLDRNVSFGDIVNGVVGELTDRPRPTYRGASGQMKGLNEASRRTAQGPSVKDVQARLAQKGFDIDVDGVRGPETEAALRAERNGVDPHQWNVSRNRQAAVAANRQVRVGGGGGGGNQQTRISPAPAPKGKGKRATVAAGDAGDGGLSLDQLALAMTDAEYGTPISELEREQARQEAQGTQNQNDIKSWFEGLIGQNRTNSEADRASLDSLLSDSSGLMGKILGSLDPSARSGVGSTAAFNENLLKSQGLSEANFDRNMQDALALRGRDEATEQGRRDTARGDELFQQLQDLKRERGQKLYTNREALIDNALKRQAEVTNLKATLALLPGQIEGQSLDNMMKQLGIQGQGISNDMDSLKVQQAINELTSNGMPAAGSKERQDLFGSLVEAVRAPNGKRRLPPRGTVTRINSLLRGAGINPFSQEAQEMRSAVLNAIGIKTGPRGNPIG